jgi:hypothetical protein
MRMFIVLCITFPTAGRTAAEGVGSSTYGYGPAANPSIPSGQPLSPRASQHTVMGCEEVPKTQIQARLAKC